MSETVEAKHLEFMKREVRASFTEARSLEHVLRGSFGDAAHLCDAIWEDILKGGRKSRARTREAAVAKRCGDALWSFREQIAGLKKEAGR